MVWQRLPYDLLTC